MVALPEATMVHHSRSFQSFKNPKGEYQGSLPVDTGLAGCAGEGAREASREAASQILFHWGSLLESTK